MKLRCLTMLLAITSAMGCGMPEDASFDFDFEESYYNTAYLECNGEVLVNEEFFSLDECESFRNQGPWSCQTEEWDIDC